MANIGGAFSTVYSLISYLLVAIYLFFNIKKNQYKKIYYMVILFNNLFIDKIKL